MLQVLRAKDDLFIKVLASQKSSYGTSSHPLLHILGSSPPSLISPSDPLYKVRSSVDLKSIAIMAPKTLLLALGAANFASAHFGLAYPSWRADTLSGTNLTGYSQWTYPCTALPFPSHSCLRLPVTRVRQVTQADFLTRCRRPLWQRQRHRLAPGRRLHRARPAPRLDLRLHQPRPRVRRQRHNAQHHPDPAVLERYWLRHPLR